MERKRKNIKKNNQGPKMKRKKIKKKTTKKIKKEKQKKIPRNECSECGSNNVYYSKISDEIICRDCGAIFAELIPEEEKKFEKARKQK